MGRHERGNQRPHWAECDVVRFMIMDLSKMMFKTMIVVVITCSLSRILEFPWKDSRVELMKLSDGAREISFVLELEK